ncbi:MAG: c-type cytochrome [Pseudomonadota bacterium]
MTIKTPLAAALCIALFAPAAGLCASAAGHEYAQVLASKPDLENGEKLFQQCAACHGVDGGGATDGSTPRIAGQYFRVVARQLVDFRHGYRWDFRMEEMASGHHLKDAQDIADVAGYIASLERHGVRGVGNGQNLELGAKLYAADCASCHGANAEGKEGENVPRLGGQHAGYLVRQIYDTVDGRRPMLSRSHTQRFSSYEFEEVLALSDYLARVGWKNDVIEPQSPQFTLPK